jgi:hypothetical protein
MISFVSVAERILRSFTAAVSFVSSHQMSLIPGIFAFWWGSDLFLGGFDEVSNLNSTVFPSSSAADSESPQPALEINGCGTVLRKVRSNFRRFVDWGRLHSHLHF